MRFREVTTPLPGERLVEVSPTPAPFVDADWRRERFVAGRAVSAAALEHEQGIRAARVAQGARGLLPGVVVGLRLRRADGAKQLVLEPGMGIATSGEDVVIPARVTFDPMALPVAGAEDERLDAWIGRGAGLPLMVLVAQPVMVEDGPGGDACERDPDAEAFEDRRWVDGTRLLWYPVTAAVGPHVAASLTTMALGAFRNQIAWAIFDDEAEGVLPWTALGVPIALCMFAADNTIAYIDHAAVARRGGERALDADRVIAPPPSAIARFDQVCDELADEDLPARFALRDRLLRIPPVGVLPRDLFDLVARSSSAFPADWGVTAAPIPIDQLEEVIRGGAELAPYRLADPLEELKLFVPVDQRWFEPDLLRVADVRADFFDAAEEARDRRDDELRRRAELNARIRSLTAALRGPDNVEQPADDGATDRDAEHVAEQVLWDNPQAMAMYEFLGAASKAGTLVLTPDLVSAMAVAMLQSTALATTVTPILTTLPVETPIAIGATTGALVTRSGLGFALPCHPVLGYARVSGARLITASAGRIVCHVGVLGVQDLDAYVAGNNSTPLAILTLGADELALEEMAWRRRRSLFLPEVLVLDGEAAVARERLLDVRVRLTGNAATTPTGTIATTGALSLTEAELVVELPPGARAPALTTRLAQVDGLLATAPTVELRLRRGLLDGRAAVILAGPDPALHHRVRATVETIRRLQRRTADGADEQVLLREVGGALEPAYGTEPTPYGLGSTTVQALVDALLLLETPLATRTVGGNEVTPKVPVVSSKELGRLAQYGVQGLIELLEEKVKHASDVVDLGFVQVQAAVYRVREQILGRDAAQKMAASPILGEVAEVLDGDASPDQVAKFFEALRAAAAPVPSGNGVIRGAASAVVPRTILEQESLSFQLGDLKAVSAAAAVIPPAPSVAAPPPRDAGKLLDGTTHASPFLTQVLSQPPPSGTAANVRNLIVSGTKRRTTGK